MKPENKVSFQRLVNATRYSSQGLKAAYLFEAAFRQQVWVAILLIPLGFYCGNGAVEKILLVGSVFLVMIAELLNSAVEAVVDRVSEEFHELSGRAKDFGSAAVFMSMILFGITWIAILFF